MTSESAVSMELSTWDFIKKELVDAAKTFAGGAWMAWKWTALLIFLYFIGMALFDLKNINGLTEFIQVTIIVAGLSVYCAFFVAVATGGFLLVWRLFGVWSLVSVICATLCFWLLFWLTQDWLIGLGADIINALLLSAKAHGLPATKFAFAKSWQGMRIAHAGPAALPIIVVLLVIQVGPALIGDLLQIGFAGPVLWEVFQMLAGFFVVIMSATIFAAVLTIPPLFIAFLARLRGRYKDAQAETAEA